MKKKLSYFFLIVSIMFQCSTNEQGNKSESKKETTATSVDSTKYNLSSGRDPISIESTVELSHLLLEEDALNLLARLEMYGGVFEANAFAEQGGKNYIRLWYCYNPRNTSLPKVFLALEHIVDYDQKDPEKLTPDNNVFIVSETFQYDQPDIESNTIKDFIVNHKAVTTEHTAKQINQAEVKEFSENFKSLISNISPGRPYNKYAVAIFKYDPSYHDFLTLTPKPMWVRYYMGLARDPDHKPNYLRPVLAGVDDHRVTIVVKDRADDPFLQKSIPPPPIN